MSLRDMRVLEPATAAPCHARLKIGSLQFENRPRHPARHPAEPDTKEGQAAPRGA